MERYLLLTGLVLICGCNMVETLGNDMAYYGSSLAKYARDNSSVPHQAPPEPMTSAPTFAPGERVTLAKPAPLRGQPSLNAAVVGYGEPGETYEVIGQKGDWVEIGADRKPLAWVFDTFLTVLSAQN